MKSDFKIPTDFTGQRSDHHLSDNCASSITADIRCLCPHLDAYLPKFLDTQGLGLCSEQIGSQTLNHPSKRIRRSTISSLHLSSIIDPSCNNEKAKSAKTLDSNSLPASKGIKYMLGEQERNLDLYLSGIIGYTPLLPSTFVEKVIDERTFEAKATKSFDASPGKCVSLERMDTVKLGKLENSQRMFDTGLGERKVGNNVKIPFYSTEKNPTDDNIPTPLSVNHEEDYNHLLDIKDKILRLRKQILDENQVGEKKKSITSIPSSLETDDTDEALTTDNIVEIQTQREIDLRLANKRVTRWLETINQNRSKYWSDRKSEKACSFSCKFCLKGALKKKEKIENPPFGDSCLQCLDCGLIACCVDFLECQNTKRHMQQHFLYSGHSLGITCGSRGEIFCMKCGDFVYNQVFDREKERIDIQFQLPRYAWGRNEPLLRSFSLGDILEDFVIIPEEIDKQSGDRNIVNKVVWRGLRASYPSEVPEEFIEAARCTLKRFNFLHDSLIESKPQENGNRPQAYFEKPIGM